MPDSNKGGVSRKEHEQKSAAGIKGNLVRWGTKRERCPCGITTLKRAKARGRETTHKPICPFYKPVKTVRLSGKGRAA